MDVTESTARFEDVCSALAPAVLRVAATLVGSAQAEDAAQEAMLRAWRSWAELRDVAAARPWAATYHRECLPELVARSQRRRARA